MRRTETNIALAKWRLTLQTGDLSWVTFYNSGFVHLSRLGKPKSDDNEDRSLWGGYALCGVGRKYYARALYIDSERENYSHDRCKRCLARWRTLGEPAISAPAVKPVEQSGIWLAFGWRAVPAVGIDFDLGKDATEAALAKSTDDAGKVWGEKRTERQRWQRGDKYVRICEQFEADHRFVVRYGFVGEPKTDSWTLKGNLKACLDKASRLMAIGGTPS
jgi:hypothetical protein